MATKKKRVPKHIPEPERSSLGLWPLVALTLIAIGVYFALRQAPIRVMNNLPPTRQVAPTVPSPIVAAAAPSKLPPVTRPHSLSGGAIKVWDRAKDSKVTFKVMRGKDESAEVRLFNAKNKLVRLMSSEKGKRGWVKLVWDGLDSQGQKVEPGTYFARISREGGDLIQEIRVR